MNFFPSKVESQLSTLSIHDLILRFSSLVKTSEDSSEQQFIFQGSWNNEGFTISQILKKANKYTPVIAGEITVIEDGLLINVRFSLSRMAKRRLLIFTIVALALTAFFILGYNSWLYGIITFGIAMVNYILAREHFDAQANKSRHALKRLFSAE